MNTVLGVHQLAKRYVDVVAASDVSFSVREGESFGILGSNGVGNTTTLEIIEALRRPDAGHVTLPGHGICQPAEKRWTEGSAPTPPDAAWHPNEWGMAAQAELILEALGS